MQGLLHRLFLEKWKKFARHYWYSLTLVLLAYWLVLMLIVLQMKLGYADKVSVPYLFTYLALAPILLFENLRGCWNAWCNSSKNDGIFNSDDVKAVAAWGISQNVHFVLISIGVGAYPCYRLLADALSDGPGTVDFDELWLWLATALFFITEVLLQMVFAPMQRLGVLRRTMLQMLTHDVAVYMVLFAAVLVHYGTLMFVANPHRASEVGNDRVPEFNTIFGALKAMLEVSLLQIRVNVGFTDEDGQILLPLADVDGNAKIAKTVDYLAFLFFYFLLATITCILMLNLLIAMLNNTFERISERATLEWRVGFARMILRVELQTSFLADRFKSWDQTVGVAKVGLDYKVYYFQDVQPNAEGYGTGGVRSVFEREILDDDPMKDELPVADAQSQGAWDADSGARSDRARPGRTTPKKGGLTPSASNTLTGEAAPGAAETVGPQEGESDDSEDEGLTSVHGNLIV